MHGLAASLGQISQSLPRYQPSPVLQAHRRARLPCRLIRQRIRAAVDLATAAPPTPSPPSYSSVQEIRSFLLQTGWQRAWIDGIADRLVKREFETTVDRCKENITYLQGLGIPNNNVCNMTSRAPRLLAQDLEQSLKPIVSCIEKRGVSGSPLALLLSQHPKLLLYTVSSDGRHLELGRARAQVDVSEKNGQRSANVLYWREGAAFIKSPLSPWRPSDS